VERQAIAAMLNNAVHLLFKLGIQLGQATTHIAALAHLFGDDFIQRHATFSTRQRTFINPRQALRNSA
jgi:hypothetical protein